MDKNSTAELTRRMARGDTNALAVFYERWFAMMFAEARRQCRRDESFCMDIVQDVVLRIIKRMPPMRTDAQLASWLRTVVRSCICDRLRSEHARLRREQTRTLPRDVHDPDDEFSQERLRWLTREIDRLDEKLRRPLLLRVMRGWTLAQIGQALGLTPGAVDGRVNRALQILRRGAARTGAMHDD